jgi:hypothetical protein
MRKLNGKMIPTGVVPFEILGIRPGLTNTLQIVASIEEKSLGNFEKLTEQRQLKYENFVGPKVRPH